MPKFRVDPREVKKVQMKDGTVYTPDRRGYVSVSHRHEDEMAHSRAPRERKGQDLDYLVLAMPGGAGKSCVCGFTAWTWQTVCPRCGSAL